MKRVAIVMAMAMLVSAGITRAATEEKTMTVAGDVKSVTADSLTINDGTGKDWTFVLDSKTKVIPKNEPIDVPPTSNVNKVTPRKWQIADIKEGQRVQVKYRAVKGKNLAKSVQIP